MAPKRTRGLDARGWDALDVLIEDSSAGRRLAELRRNPAARPADSPRNPQQPTGSGDDADARALSRALPFRELVFARQKLRLFAELRGLDPNDRLTPLLAALPADLRAGDVWVEHPDSDAGKPLSGLARSFGNALRPALRKAGLLSAREDARLPRLHVCFLDGDHVLLALADSSSGVADVLPDRGPASLAAFRDSRPNYRRTIEVTITCGNAMVERIR